MYASSQKFRRLHERGGSSIVIHLHGEITKARSCENPDEIYSVGYADIRSGETCKAGRQLRPHIVWFGEDVPLYPVAEYIIARADKI